MAVRQARLALIAAVARNGVIGRDNDLPWRLPADMRNFRAVTAGKPLICGRRTFESLGSKALPGRPLIVVAGRPIAPGDNVHPAANWDAALNRARALAAESGAEEIIAIGGAGIYAAALRAAERLYLTEVLAEVDGQVRFPAYDRAAWREVARRQIRNEAGASHDYDLTVWERRPAS